MFRPFARLVDVKLFRLLCVLCALLFAVSPELMSFQTKGKSSAKKSASSKTQPKSSSKSTKSTAKSSSKKAAPKKTSSSRRRRSSRSRSRYTQQTPEPERVREIQQALVDRGYAVEVNGKWDEGSVEALKKFQDDQKIKNLTGPGKLDSLTLIALGLGPKHEPAAEPPQPSREGQNP